MTPMAMLDKTSRGYNSAKSSHHAEDGAGEVTISSVDREVFLWAKEVSNSSFFILCRIRLEK